MGKPYRNSLLKIEPSKSCFKVELNSIKGFKTRKDRLCKSDPFLSIILKQSSRYLEHLRHVHQKSILNWLE